MKFSETELEIFNKLTKEFNTVDHKVLENMFDGLIQFDRVDTAQAPDMGGAKLIADFRMEASREDIMRCYMENDITPSRKSDNPEYAVAFILIKRKILDAIKESPCFKISRENDKKELEKLRKEVSELSEYKTYYDLQFKLNHGRSASSIDSINVQN